MLRLRAQLHFLHNPWITPPAFQWARTAPEAQSRQGAKPKSDTRSMGERLVFLGCCCEVQAWGPLGMGGLQARGSFCSPGVS